MINETGQKDSQVHTYNESLWSTFWKCWNATLSCFQSAWLVLGKQLWIVSLQMNTLFVFRLKTQSADYQIVAFLVNSQSVDNHTKGSQK